MVCVDITLESRMYAYTVRPWERKSLSSQVLGRLSAFTTVFVKLVNTVYVRILKVEVCLFSHCLQQPLYPDQGRCGSRVYPRNTGWENQHISILGAIQHIHFFQNSYTTTYSGFPTLTHTQAFPIPVFQNFGSQKTKTVDFLLSLVPSFRRVTESDRTLLVRTDTDNDQITVSCYRAAGQQQAVSDRLMVGELLPLFLFIPHSSDPLQMGHWQRMSIKLPI